MAGDCLCVCDGMVGNSLEDGLCVCDGVVGNSLEDALEGDGLCVCDGVVGNSLEDGFEDELRDGGGAVDEVAVFVNVNTKRSAGLKGYFWM